MNKTTICSLAKRNQLHSETPVENLFIMEYMIKAPGDCVKVYLYALMQAHYPGLAEASVSHFARALAMDEEKVLDAFAYWQRQGIAHYIEDGEVVFEIERIYDTLLEDGSAVKEVKLYGRAELNAKIQGIFGKRYFRDFAKIYDWLDVYGLPEDVVLFLIDYCVRNRGPSVRINFLDTVALDWANNGIKTVAAAENYLLGRAIETSDAKKVLRHIGIHRSPSVDEYELYNKWMGWGFTLDTVLLASKEMTRIQKPNFAYVDKILERLKDRGATDHKSASAALSEKAPPPPGTPPRAKDGNARSWAKNAPNSFMSSEYDKYNPDAGKLLEDDPNEA